MIFFLTFTIAALGFLRNRELKLKQRDDYQIKIYSKSIKMMQKLSILKKLYQLKNNTSISSFQLSLKHFLPNCSNKIFQVTLSFLNSSRYKDFKKLVQLVDNSELTFHISSFHCQRNVVQLPELLSAFKKVVNLYHEMPLPRYSRYENWTRSCYMEVHEKWTPKTETNEDLRKALEQVLLEGKKAFTKWYCFKNGLKDVKVVTMNSFVTKYIPKPGMNEFGKHVDGIKIDGSLIMALPEELDLLEAGLEKMSEGLVTERHNWEGLLVWDAPRKKDLKRALKSSNQDKFSVKLGPGDCCFLEKLVWHHGLPIHSGARYVIVCFYQCIWQGIDA